MPTKKPDEFAAAQEALNANDLAGAKTLYERIIKRDSGNPLAFAGLGQVAYQKGYLDDAEALFEEAYELGLEAFDGEMPKKLPWNQKNEGLLRAIHGRGMIAYRKNQTEDARHWFELLLKLNPADQQGAHFFADAIKRGKKWAEMG